MREKLSFKESLLIGSLLFGLFFGAGNLIFPVELGQRSGDNGILAIIGFLLSGVGIPVIGVVASALSKSESLYEMALPVSRKYSIFFTCLLYLTIGPFFAIPRTSTVAFEVGIRAFIGDANIGFALFIFSAIFFLTALYFSLKPGKLMDYIGKYMTPIFLGLLSILIIMSILRPMGPFSTNAPIEKYQAQPLFVGLIDGYNTMDALASLAFAIIIISNIRKLGVQDPKAVAKETLKSGLVCILGMGFVYSALSYMGSTSLGIMSLGENGGLVLSEISRFYLGNAGKILLASIVTLACLKTGIGLISACGQMFEEMFPNSLSYNKYVMVFTLVSFGIANLGLDKIIALSIPVLMFTYPLAIVLIILSLMAPIIDKSPIVYKWAIAFTFLAAIFDFLKALPELVNINPLVVSMVNFAKQVLPGFELGFGWVLPACIGLLLGLIFWKLSEKKRKEAVL